MALALVLSGIILSIVKANQWFIVPQFCIVFCYVVGFFYGWAYTVSKSLIKDVQRIKNKEG